MMFVIGVIVLQASACVYYLLHEKWWDAFIWFGVTLTNIGVLNK